MERELKPSWGDNRLRDTKRVWVIKSAGKGREMKRLRDSGKGVMWGHVWGMQGAGSTNDLA